MPKTKHVFIDGSHVVMTIRKKSGAQVRDDPVRGFDYGRMLDAILHGAKVGEHSAVYLSRPPDGRISYLSFEDEAVFHRHSLTMRRYDLSERVVQCHQCGHAFTLFREKPVDAAIITGMFKAALRAGPEDSIVLVSGDGDFLEAVEEIMSPDDGFGVPVQVYGFDDSTNLGFKNNQKFNFQPLDPYLASSRATTRVVRRRGVDSPWPRTKM